MRRLLIVLSMTIDAPAHLELGHGHEIAETGVRNEIKLVDLFHRSVTRLAFDARLDVAIVAELDVLRQPMDLNPFDRFLLFPVLLQYPNALDLVVFERELRVASHAELDGGDAGGLGLVGARVAIETLDLEFARVVFVVIPRTS